MSSATATEDKMFTVRQRLLAFLAALVLTVVVVLALGFAV